MLKQNHIAVTQCAATFLVLNDCIAYSEALPFLVGSYFGSDLPDVDHPNNHLHQTLRKLHLISDHTNHRGLTHTIYPVILFVIIWLGWLHSSNVFLIPVANFFGGLAFGYFMHLLIDNFSIQGVLWFYPFQTWMISKNGHPYKYRKYKVPLYRTGGNFEFYFGLIARILWYIMSVRWFYMFFQLLITSRFAA